jgi:hypothetical protein
MMEFEEEENPVHLRRQSWEMGAWSRRRLFTSMEPQLQLVF